MATNLKWRSACGSGDGGIVSENEERTALSIAEKIPTPKLFLVKS